MSRPRRTGTGGTRVEPDSEELVWQQRVVGRSLHDARQRSIDRGSRFVRAAAAVLERSNGALTVQDVADEAGQSVKTLYQCFASKDDLLLAVFEEAMRRYADKIRAAIADVEDPVERVAAGVIASVRLAELLGKAGFDRGLSLLRQQLSHADPGLLAMSQEPVTAVFRDLVLAAPPAADAAMPADAATYLVVSLRAAYVSSMTLGNEFSGPMPDVIDLACFVMRGLGLPRSRSWLEAIDTRLGLSPGGGSSILRRLARGA